MAVKEEARPLEISKANVLLQCQNVRSYPPVRQALGEGRLTVLGWLFDLESGNLMAYDDQSATWQEVLTVPENEESAPA
jgi:carbonic anhydrase